VELSNWPAVLERARVLLRERYGIGHVTLQPEVAPDPGRRGQSVVKVVARR
jgi:hypothetical protein